MNRDGFSLIEVMVALIILTAGILAMASSTGWVSLQVRAADVRTERSTAYQQVIEELRALHFDSMSSRSYGSAAQVGSFKVWWDVTTLDWGLANVNLYSEGPGFLHGAKSDTVGDTISVRIARPYP